jgi:hypothetical protein
VALAQRYGRPLVAWLRHPGEIEGLPPGVRVEADFEAITRFVRDALGAGPGR